MVVQAADSFLLVSGLIYFVEIQLVESGLERKRKGMEIEEDSVKSKGVAQHL